jgi:hypothetical protein
MSVAAAGRSARPAVGGWHAVLRKNCSPPTAVIPIFTLLSLQMACPVLGFFPLLDTAEQAD